MNPVFAWIAYGFGIFAAFMWIAAVTNHLAIARNFGTPGNKDRTNRDNSITAGLVFTLITIALIVLAVAIP